MRIRFFITWWTHTGNIVSCLRACLWEIRGNLRKLEELIKEILLNGKGMHCTRGLDGGVLKISFVFSFNSLIARKLVNLTNGRGAGHGVKNGSTTYCPKARAIYAVTAGLQRKGK